MADCPNETCQKNLMEVREAVFGKGGLRESIGNKVSKAALWAAVVIIGIPLFMTGIKVWSGHEASALRFADSQAFSSLKERVSIQETQYKSICETLVDIKATLMEVRRDLKTSDRHRE